MAIVLNLNSHMQKALPGFKATSVGQAVYGIYNSGVEFDIHWNHFKISLDGINLSNIYIEIIWLLKDLESGKDRFSAFFLDPGFTAEWKLTVKENIITIEPFWTVVFGHGANDNILYDADMVRSFNLTPLTSMPKDDFIESWIKILKIIRKDLENAGYGWELKDFDDLVKYTGK